MSAEYEYKIIEGHNYDKLAEEINEEAAQGWEPVTVYAWGPDMYHHSALLRRPLTNAPITTKERA